MVILGGIIIALTVCLVVVVNEKIRELQSRIKSLEFNVLMLKSHVNKMHKRIKEIVGD